MASKINQRIFVLGQLYRVPDGDGQKLRPSQQSFASVILEYLRIPKIADA
jgi:hypothetical protein